MGSFSSCKKDPVLEKYPNFQGSWIHYESTTKYKELHIYSNNKGFIWYSEGWSVYGDTQIRKWVVKNDYLYFGWLAGGNEKFKITQYPTVADSAFIVGADTIAIGCSYMILDDSYFSTCF